MKFTELLKLPFQKEKTKFNGTVRSLREDDLISIKPILETWVISRVTHELVPEEVEEDLQLMRGSIRGSDRKYFVAETDDKQVIGVIGMVKIKKGSRMMEFATTNNPIELVNAYVSKNQRMGKGVGTALVKMLENEARTAGYKEIVLNSGPRYKETGWKFYDKLKDFHRAGVAVKLYGDRGDAPVWRKKL